MTFEILIPVWGERYIEHFAEFGLRSLLSHGNLPWLSLNHRVQATVLTTGASRPYVDAQPAFQRLAELTQISFVEIDDLLETYGSNYSVILTRAFNRAMALNRDMLGTAFIYLVGDLVFADGALRTIAKAVENGRRACIMCSPRVGAQALAPIFSRMGSATELHVSNRHMADLLIEHPHPTLVAKVVRDDQIHLSIVHQFFWRPRPDVMVARCFLSHMLCIKPTRRPADVAAPCDFAFLEELAPGEPYHFLDDSDAFLAVEMQDDRHESKYIRAFPLGPRDIAESLSAWATPQHHKFIEATYVFRGGSSDFSHDAGTALTQPFVDTLKTAMSPPMPHRNHLFWLGGIGAPVVTRPWDEVARQRDVCLIPPVLRRLIEEHLERLGARPLDLAICATNGPTRVEAMMTAAARVTARITPRRLNDVVEDVAAPGETLLLVMWARTQEFIELFEKTGRIYRLLRVAGEGRTMLLCFEVSPDDLRAGAPSRAHLSELFTSSFAILARFGLRAHVHDLAAAVFDKTQGVVIEIVPDETSGALARPEYTEQDDLLLGWRGEIKPGPHAS